jgi:immunity protein 5 of polymorphic toxin system
MNALKFQELLTKLGACPEAVIWAKGKSLLEVWKQCERADWLLWLCGRMVGKKGWPTREEIVLVSCDIAETVLPLFEKKYPEDKRPREAIEVARAWATCPKSDKKKAAAYAAAAYAAADAYAAAAAYAAGYAAAPYAAAAAAYAAAAYAAYAAADADAAAAAYVAAAAYAAAAAYVAAAAYISNRTAKLREFADVVRKRLNIPNEDD